MNEFTITLKPLADDDRPGIVRLRIALKVLLRAFRLKCVRIVEKPEEAAS